MLRHKRKILKLHGILLSALGIMIWFNAMVGYNFSKGPFAFLAQNEVAAVAFIEAYALAGMLGLGLTLAASRAYHAQWHLFGAAIHLILFGVNIGFWHLYEPLGLTTAGWIATLIHFFIFLIQTSCFFGRDTVKSE